MTAPQQGTVPGRTRPGGSLSDYVIAVPAAVMWHVAAALPPSFASRTGGWFLSLLGPRLRKQRNVLGNLRRVHPEASAAELRRTARGMWSNLGSVLFEYPHLSRIARERTTVTMSPAVRDMFEAGRPMLFVAGHLGNWELIANFLSGHGSGLVVVYSPRRNAVLDAMIQRFRCRDGGEYVTKAEALRRLSRRNLNGRSVGMLPDVRIDSGVPIPLFGVDASTTISPARLADRLGYPVVPARAKRLGPARFELEFLDPLVAAAGLSGKEAAIDVMRSFNRLLESWIRERPTEWLCTKRRWLRPGEGASRAATATADA